MVGRTGAYRDEEEAEPPQRDRDVGAAILVVLVDELLNL
jgi:hypothetical protein